MVMARDATSKFFEKMKRKELSIVGAGRAWSLAREARHHMREEPNLHLDIYQ